MKFFGIGKLKGQLRYIKSERSFSFFDAENRAELEQRTGGGVGWLTVAYLEIAVSLKRGDLLFVDGYHPNDFWQPGTVPVVVPSTEQHSVTISEYYLRQLNEEGSVPIMTAIDHIDCYTIYDENTGWVWIGSLLASPERMPDQCTYIEFAEGCVACLSDNQMIALYLKPIFVD